MKGEKLFGLFEGVVTLIFFVVMKMIFRKVYCWEQV